MDISVTEYTNVFNMMSSFSSHSVDNVAQTAALYASRSSEIPAPVNQFLDLPVFLFFNHLSCQNKPILFKTFQMTIYVQIQLKWI